MRFYFSKLQDSLNNLRNQGVNFKKQIEAESITYNAVYLEKVMVVHNKCDREVSYFSYSRGERKAISENEFNSQCHMKSHISIFRFSQVIASTQEKKSFIKGSSGWLIEVYSKNGSGFNFSKWSKIPGNK